MFDHRNGTYEVAFLLIEPGTYTLKAYLEHSLCDGLKDPPDNWFIVGKNLPNLSQGCFLHFAITV